MKIPLQQRINLRGHFQRRGVELALADSANITAVAGEFMRAFGYPLCLWLANPYRRSMWRQTREYLHGS